MSAELSEALRHESRVVSRLLSEHVRSAACAVLFVLAGTPAMAATVNETATLTVDEGRWFGWSVDVDGDRLVAGRTNSSESDGDAYIFDRLADGTWVEIAQLRGSDQTAADSFAYSVAISGGSALVGAAFAPLGACVDAGAAYLFEEQADGSWDEVAKFVPPVCWGADEFGYSVAIDGDLAVVGARRHEVDLAEEGGVYVWDRQQDGSWLAAGRVIPSNPDAFASFGRSVAIDGNRLFVGASGENIGGAAYAFDRQSDGSWLEIARVQSMDPEVFDSFGSAVDGEGDLMLVGSHGRRVDGLFQAGVAYVFERQPDGVWQQSSELSASDRSSSDRFGWAVALAEDRALVGAYQHRHQGNPDRSGSTYLFERQPNGVWTEEVEALPSLDDSFDDLGFAVAIQSNELFAGAPGGASRANKIYQFEILPDPPVLSVSGSCPGDLTLSIADATPGGLVRFVDSAVEGSATVPKGLPCAGTAIDLDAPRLVGTATADAFGGAEKVRTAAQKLCGRWLQAVDEPTCSVSQVFQIPEEIGSASPQEAHTLEAQ